MVGLGGLEPPTSRLSSARSNQLSYKPESSKVREAPKSVRGDPSSKAEPGLEGGRAAARILSKKERRRRRDPANAAFDKAA